MSEITYHCPIRGDGFPKIKIDGVFVGWQIDARNAAIFSAREVSPTYRLVHRQNQDAAKEFVKAYSDLVHSLDAERCRTTILRGYRPDQHSG